MWLRTENMVRFFDAEESDLTFGKEVPMGTWKVCFNKFIGCYLEETEVKLSHGKIYGNSQNVASHIVEAYGKNKADKNLGVLLSGDKGLGKTLTARLVMEQLNGKKPIIVVSEFLPGLPDFLMNIKGCVIFMDEFEKFMGGNANGGNNEDDQTKQETLLSVLDGNSGCAGNLFLLTVNNVWKLDENLKSRPGRIRYHYKFTSENANVVRAYCADNLVRKELTEDIVKTLGSKKFVSMDILSSFVEELNNFPDMTPSEAITYFNVEAEEEENFNVSIFIKFKNGETIVYHDCCQRDYMIDGRWASLKCKKSEERERLMNLGVPEHFRYSIDEDAEISSYLTNNLTADEITAEEQNFDDDLHEEDMEIIGAEIKSRDSAKFARKYGATV